MRDVLMVILAMVVGTAQARAQEGAAVSRNAAELYRQAFRALGWSLLESTPTTGPPLLSEDEQRAINEITFPIDPDVRATLERVMTVTQPMRMQIEEASRIGKCDWDLDRSAGLGMLLPHYAVMRQGAWLQRAAAFMQLDAGSGADAVATLASLGMIATHAGQDDVVIGSVVAGRISTSIFVDATSLAIENGSIGQDEAKAILDAVRPLKGDDPFRAVEAVRGEWELLDATVRSPKADEVLAWVADNADDASTLKSLSPEDLRTQVRALKGTYDRVAAAFANPDPVAARAELERIGRMAESGRLGELAKAIMPHFAVMHESNRANVAALAVLLERLRSIAEGKVKPEELTNAALLLARASGAARSILKDDQEAIELARVAPGALDEASRVRAAELIARSDAAILKPLAAATRCKTCDFESLRRGWAQVSLHTRLMGGVRGAVRVALADGLARVRAGGGPDAVVPAAATAFRVSALLSTSPGFPAATVAHAIWRDATAAVQEATAGGKFSKSAGDEVQRAMATMPTDDPFGWRRAVEREARKVAAESTGGMRIARNAGGDHPSVALRTQLLKQRGATAVFSLVAFMAAGTDGDGDPEPAADDGALVGMGNLYPAAGFAAVHAARTAWEEKPDRKFVPIDLAPDQEKNEFRRWDPLRGANFIDASQRMAESAADYMRGIDVVKAAS
jgi:hypothetical protein